MKFSDIKEGQEFFFKGGKYKKSGNKGAWYQEGQEHQAEFKDNEEVIIAW